MKNLFLSLLAIILIIEEWLWEFLSATSHYIVKLLRLEKLEIWISQTSPNVALLAFMIPILIVTPINLAAVWLLLQGLILNGILLEIFAKLLGTLLIARVFKLTKNQLLTFKSIDIIYQTITAWLSWAHSKIIDTDIYKFSKQIKVQLKAKFKELFGH